MITIWHNPRCSKSREALKLIEQSGTAVTVRRYLDDAPDAAEIRAALTALGNPAAKDIVRTTEKLFRDLGLRKDMDDATLIAAMAAHPILIERPIVFAKGRAVIGRPPGQVLDLL